LPRLIILQFEVEQQAQPAPWEPFSDDNVRGTWALRSFAACAILDCADILRQTGAVSMTRGAFTPHPGQSDGNSYSAIDRSLVNGPQLSHIYSYTGMTGILLHVVGA
jgi:hypothetical protein